MAPPAVEAHPAPEAPPAADYTSDNPTTTGDSKPHTDGGGGVCSGREGELAEHIKDAFNTTAPASMTQVELRSTQNALPAPSNGYGSKAPVSRPSQSSGDASQAPADPTPSQQKQVPETLASSSPRKAHSQDPIADQAAPAPPPTSAVADEVEARPPSKHPERVPEAREFPQPFKTKLRLGPSHQQAMPRSISPMLPTEIWDFSTTDSCPPDQPMPDFKSIPLPGDAQTTSMTVPSILEEHSADLPNNSSRSNGVPAQPATCSDGAPGVSSIAEVNQRIGANFQRHLSSIGGGHPVLISENKSISTPLASVNRAHSDIDDSNCIQSVVLLQPARVTDPSVGPAATDAEPAIAVVPAREDDNGGGGQAATTSVDAPDSTGIHTVPAAAQLASAMDQPHASPERKEGATAAATPSTEDVTYPSRERGASTVTDKLVGPPYDTRTDTQSSQFWGSVFGAQTTAWMENGSRHIVLDGIEPRNEFTANETEKPHVRLNCLGWWLHAACKCCLMYTACG
jgi:hypothetical protein